MKLLVTGVCGQLGHDVLFELIRRDHEVIGSDVKPSFTDADNRQIISPASYIPLDITDRNAVFDAIETTRPDAVIHCAAWTAVDAAEEPENYVTVDRINHMGTKYIAEAVKKINAKMLYLSTDYVFSGKGTEPWGPDRKEFEPLNNYGRSKLNGELAVSEILEKFFIVRISWVFGANGNNFVKTMLKIGEKGADVRVVRDQIGTPTYTYDLARLLADMIETEKYGYYHATNSEIEKGLYISWFDFAKEIFQQAGMSINVIPVTTEEYRVSKAARPFNSRMDKQKLIENGFQPLPVWKNALSRYLREIHGVE